MPDLPQYWVRKIQTRDPVSSISIMDHWNHLLSRPAIWDPPTQTDASLKIQNAIEIHHLLGSSQMTWGCPPFLPLSYLEIQLLGESTLFDSA